MNAEIFRTQKNIRNPWRVKIDGCTLSLNFKSDTDARRFIVRTERLSLMTTYDVVLARNAATEPTTRAQYADELTRRDCLTKHTFQKIMESAR